MEIEVSNGEIIDKYTILIIKTEKIVDEAKLTNVEKELEALKYIVASIPFHIFDYLDLLEVNNKLWDVEDEIRECEASSRFDDYFISLARQVYMMNDKRATIKKRINIKTNSNLIEEKSYKQ
jgi:hypothetical protein